MDGVAVARWRKYGKDRLYVTGADGGQLGWHDLVSGESHLEDPASSAVFQAAVADWLRPAAGSAEIVPGPPSAQGDEVVSPEADAAGPEAATVQPPIDPPVAVADPQWEDLAARRAGAMAREQAVALREAAPVRTFVARVLGVHTDERAWRIGADGEEKVAARLERLVRKDPRWRVLHAIPVGENGSDIDHLVIGPGGVFSLNAKHHPDAKLWISGNTFMVNGQRQPYLRNSRHEAARASKLLAACGFPVVVTGVVVPVGAADLVIKTAPVDVHVVNRMALAKWLGHRTEVLDTVAVEAIHQAARRSTTWRPVC